MVIGAEHRVRVRVLNGPLQDCVYPCEEGLEIGRSDHADIQLSGRGVSRQHATIVPSDEGWVLLDVLSTNGTWVHGARVSKAPLQHGDRFVIDDCEFEFEVLTPEGPPAVLPSKPRISPGRLSRETADFGGPRRPGPAPRLENPTAPAVPVQTFRTGSGHPYPGNLLADIMLYRNLRLRGLRRGSKVSPASLRKFQDLDDALRHSSAKTGGRSDDRRFARFACETPGTVRFERHGDRRFEVTMVDVAVDGACIRCDALPRDQTGLVWLSVPSVGSEGLRCIVFTGRVAWSEPKRLGLVFSGAPSWATRNRDAMEDTSPTSLAPLRLKKPAG